MKQWWNDTKAYLQDNPEGYWFKAKLYGWGWVPVRWQGWLITLAAAVAAVYLSYRFEQQPGNLLLELILPLLAIFGLLLLLCRKMGEPPHWQWGPPPTNAAADTETTDDAGFDRTH